MADDQRPAETANRADHERRMAHDVAEMPAAPSPHSQAQDALSVAAPAGGYGGEHGLS
jgi:hypothetical protein